MNELNDSSSENLSRMRMKTSTALSLERGIRLPHGTTTDVSVRTAATSRSAGPTRRRTRSSTSLSGACMTKIYREKYGEQVKNMIHLRKFLIPSERVKVPLFIRMRRRLPRPSDNRLASQR